VFDPVKRSLRPNVSVLMAAYNEQDSIEESIQSIINQTYNVWELVIIDDCSKDNTPEILKKYADAYPDKIRVYRNPANLGLAASLNKGAKLCNAQYIARMDADDLCKPSRFQKQVTFLDDHPGIALVSGAMEYIDDGGNVFGRTYPITSPAKIRKRILQGYNVIVHPAVMLRKDVFLDCGGYCEGLMTGQDQHLWMKLLRKGYQLTMLPEVMISYRISGKAISNRKKTEAQVRLMKEILRYDDPPLHLLNAFGNEVFINKNSYIIEALRKEQILASWHCKIDRLSSKLGIPENIMERSVSFLRNVLP